MCSHIPGPLPQARAVNGSPLVLQLKPLTSERIRLVGAMSWCKDESQDIWHNQTSVDWNRRISLSIVKCHLAYSSVQMLALRVRRLDVSTAAEKIIYA